MQKRQNTRKIRINDEIQREVANIIRGDLKDPRIGAITTVVAAETASDLSLSKIYVSIMAEKEEKEQSLEVLKGAAGYIRRELAARINLRTTPEIKFILDETLDQSMKIESILNEIKKT